MREIVFAVKVISIFMVQTKKCANKVCFLKTLRAAKIYLRFETYTVPQVGQYSWFIKNYHSLYRIICQVYVIKY